MALPRACVRLLGIGFLRAERRRSLGGVAVFGRASSHPSDIA
ncbi:hypothetical protein [Nonomuraea dietziae]